MELRGIDVSEHNGIINWDNLKDKIDFAIIRIGWIGNRQNHTLDKQFIRNYTECKRLGIKIGAYIYNYCNSIETVKNGADWCINHIKSHDFDLPIYFDIEDNSLATLGKDNLTNIVIAFNTIIEKAGYWAGIYANLNWFTNFLNRDLLCNKYTSWIAHYTSETNLYKGQYDMWQMSSNYTFPNVGGKFDYNIMYRNLIDDIINSANNSDAQSKIDLKLNTVIADEVIAGKWRRRFNA